MVWTGVLRAVLLLFLLSSGIWDVEGQETVDLKALEYIVGVINIHASQTASPPGSRSSSPAAARSASGAASRSSSPAAARSASGAASRSSSPAAARSASGAASRSSSPAAARPASGAASRSSSPAASGAASRSGRTDEMQYAMAVRIAKNQCLQNFNVNNLESLKREVSDFKNKLGNKVKDVYEGNVMVAARYTSHIHSEYRLLMEGGGEVINKLLKTTGSINVEDCVIFYTYNSPCLKTCLGDDKEAKQLDENLRKKGKTPRGKYKCIYPALDIFNRVSGPKAFVFTKIYWEDMNKQELSDCLGKITEKLPLYQCDNNNKCKRCDQGNSYCTGTAAGADRAG